MTVNKIRAYIHTLEYIRIADKGCWNVYEQLAGDKTDVL